MCKKYYFLLTLAFFVNAANAQLLKGSVSDKSKEPVIGATIYWANAPSKGVATDIEGKFSLPILKNEDKLIVSAIGFRTDSIVVNSLTDVVNITLVESSETLNEVVVKGQSILLDRLNPIQTETITTKALAKAACCNLSESFETNASVSVSLGDAVTGAKQLSFLGLSGKYVQTTFEGLPAIRGLETTFGLLYVPGTWIQAIDISKGVGSVLTGYESLTGGINIELMKPDNSEKLYVNTYLNSLGRGEININAAHKINEKWSFGVLSHGSTLRNSIDRNGDDFLDAPKYNQVNILNRWKYQSSRLFSQFGVKYVKDARTGGQTNFVSRTETPLSYGYTNATNRVEVFSKTAILFPEAPYRGLALILNAAKHNSDSFFGKRQYQASQDYGYGNLIYQDKIGTTMHTYKTGLSFVYDDYDEQFGSISLLRREIVPGAYLEYTYNFLDKTILVLGARADFHNLYGTQFTPRIHFKHDLSENLIFRASAGSGFRVPNRLVEYYGNLVSNRQVVFTNALQPEKSWNYGLSLTKTMGKSSLILDFYRTDFTNKLIGDVEHPEYLYFYNSSERAFADAFQIEYNWVPSDRWEAKVAYRYLNTKQTMGQPFDESVLLPVMFQSPSRVLFNVGYALPFDKWKADLTVNWNSKSRIPTTALDYDHTSYETRPVE
ncbi:MAG: TonB-dependent receptor, partial [Spirosomaceae bacterium]|nr:TonB-dependent receptor [Spirosomataceae bacterium]